jgi:hypothetical protein
MPSADDLFNQLVAANNRLEDIKGDLVDVKGAVNGVTAAVNVVNATLLNGFNQLVTLGQYTNQALYQNDQQNDTIICLLEHISKNTCDLVNQAALQTEAQLHMERDIDTLESMFATVNAGAALEAAAVQFYPVPCAETDRSASPGGRHQAGTPQMTRRQ